MRLFFSFCAALLLSGMALGQSPMRAYAGAYGYGPYVPLIITPEISFETVSPAPIGARNATFGLTAGARNSTFETMNDNASSNYTEALWYSGGGAPVMSSEISLEPRPMHPRHEMHRMMMMEDHHAEHAESGEAEWTYLADWETESPVDTSAGKSAKHATRTITNDDIDRFNQNTGNVKYDSKTEKIQ
jgi:hypothetical protein